MSHRWTQTDPKKEEQKIQAPSLNSLELVTRGRSFFSVIMEAIPQDIYYVKCQEVLLDDFQGYSLGGGRTGLTWEAIPSNHCVWLMFTKQHPPEVETHFFFIIWRQKRNTNRCPWMFNHAVWRPDQITLCLLHLPVRRRRFSPTFLLSLTPFKTRNKII